MQYEVDDRRSHAARSWCSAPASQWRVTVDGTPASGGRRADRRPDAVAAPRRRRRARRRPERRAVVAPRPVAGELDVQSNGRTCRRRQCGRPGAGRRRRRRRDAPAVRSASSRRCPARWCGCWSPRRRRDGPPGARRRRSDEDGERAARGPRRAAWCRWPSPRAVGGRGRGAGRRGVAGRCGAALLRRRSGAAPRAAGLAGRGRGASPRCWSRSSPSISARRCAAGRERRQQLDRPAAAHRPPRPQPRPRAFVVEDLRIEGLTPAHDPGSSPGASSWR